MSQKSFITVRNTWVIANAMKGDSMKKDGDAMQKSPSPTATNKP
jgi:hypothetical protein